MHLAPRVGPTIIAQTLQQPGIPKVRAIKRDTSAAPLDPSVSMIVHGTLMYLNLTFMN